MSYLIYKTQAKAVDRAEQEGIAKALPYHTGKGATRYLTYPTPTADGKWALDVSGYDLTEDEQDAVVESVEWALDVSGYDLTEDEQDAVVESVGWPTEEGI